MKYNLATDQKVWDNPYPLGIDSHAITPDGKTIYMPTGEDDLTHSQWQIIDTSSGNVTGSIDSTVEAPHNTIVSNNGVHVYMGSVHSDIGGDHRNYLVEADASDGSIVQRIGPTLGIATRPFTIDSQERWAFITTLGVNGFQVGSVSTGAILFTVSAQGVSNASCTAFVTCSHGISLSPDDKEIYMVDYYNNDVHIFDVSGLPSSAPQWVAKIPLAHSYTESGASVTHSRDGRFVFVGQSGDVIDTNTRRIVGYLTALSTSKIYTEVDFQGSQVSFTPLSRSGVGYAH
jgi:DNA-binding beta-propeller fold protein YncE